MRPVTRRLLPAALLAGALALPAAASANSTAKQIKAAQQSAVAYLRTQQLPSGRFPGFGGEWVLTSLAAAGVPAVTVKSSGGSTDARTYYRELVGDTETWPGTSEPPVADFDTAALAAYAAGIDPARVSQSQNLLAQITARYDTAHPGYYGEAGDFNGTVFSLIALADARTRTGGQRMPQALLDQTVAVVRANQHTDGGWTYLQAEGDPEELAAPSEAELTGAAMASLCSAGVPAGDPAIVKAEDFLSADLKAEALGSGGFETEFGPNTDSNAWAVEGLNACHIDPQGAAFTTSQGHTPIDFLLARQLSGGGFEYSPGEGEADLYSSQDALRALSGAGFTAAPPKPKGADRWVYEPTFSQSPAVDGLLTLVIEGAAPQLGVCTVRIAPLAKKTKLGAVLEAAESAASPSGCVNAVTPSSGTGPITSINGLPSPAAPKWQVSIDGGSEGQAARGTAIGLGDTIYLRLG